MSTWHPASIRRLKKRIWRLQHGYLDKEKRHMFFRRLRERVRTGKVNHAEAEALARQRYPDATPKEIGYIFDRWEPNEPKSNN